MADHSNRGEPEPPPSSDAVPLDLIPYPYQALDEEGVITAVNDAWLDELGYDRSSVEGERFADFLAADSTELLESLLGEPESSDGLEGVEFELIQNDGSTKTVVLDGRTVYDEKGKVNRINCQFKDISERKGLEKHLRWMEGAVETSGQAVYLTDSDGTIEYVNTAFEEMTGYPDEEAIGRTPRLLNSEKVPEGHPEEVRKSLDVGEVWEEEIVNCRRNGELYHAHQTISPIPDPHGEIEGFAIVQTDITERKEAERELTTLVDNLPGLVYRCRVEAGWPMDMVRGDCAELTGYSAERLENGEISFGDDIIHPDDREEVWQQIRSAAKSGDPFTLTYRIRSKKGVTKWVWEKGRVVDQIHNDVVRLEGFITDITKRKRQERNLQHYKQAIESSTEMLAAADANYAYLFANERYKEFHGLDGADLTGTPIREAMGDNRFEEIQPRIDRALDGDTIKYELSRTDRNGETRPLEIQYYPLEAQDGSIQGIVATLRDITERKQHEAILENRERMLRELHSITQNFLTAATESEVYDDIVEGMSEALDFSLFTVMEFDEANGVLETVATSPKLTDTFRETPIVHPGDGPIWNVYRESESHVFDATSLESLPDDIEVELNELLVVPIGRFGLLLTGLTQDVEFSDFDIELVELLAANTEAILDRIRRKRELHRVSEKLSTHEARVQELEELMGAFEAIQQRIAEGDTREALEAAVCEELVQIDSIDFVWIGRPQTSDFDLSPEAWAGKEGGYLDAVNLNSEDEYLPSQRAVVNRQRNNVASISRQVHDQAWAREALSRNFRSVLSIPLVHDEVLYGVLTTFSRKEDAFDQLYETSLADIGSLLVTYLSILNIRYGESHTEFIEIEFEISDSNYPLHTLSGESECRIRFDTVLETTDDSVRVLVTVLDGEVERVLKEAMEITKIRTAEHFGDPEKGQIDLTVERPFLATEVSKHGGRLVGSIADREATRARIKLPSNISVRPLVESLTTQYNEIKLVARRETDDVDSTNLPSPENILTNRQYDMLKAAYFGGYYESPRGVTGEGLGDSFGISDSAVYNHLRAAHRCLLESIFDSEYDNEGLNSQP